MTWINFPIRVKTYDLILVKKHVLFYLLSEYPSLLCIQKVHFLHWTNLINKKEYYLYYHSTKLAWNPYMFTVSPIINVFFPESLSNSTVLEFKLQRESLSHELEFFRDFYNFYISKNTLNIYFGKYFVK